MHQFSNVWSPDDPCRPVHIPDAPAEPLPDGAALSMVAGDFLEIYDGQEGALTGTMGRFHRRAHSSRHEKYCWVDVCLRAMERGGDVLFHRHGAQRRGLCQADPPAAAPRRRLAEPR